MLFEIYNAGVNFTFGILITIFILSTCQYLKRAITAFINDSTADYRNTFIYYIHDTKLGITLDCTLDHIMAHIGSILFIIAVPVIWPIALLFVCIYGILYLLRFLVRLTKYTKTTNQYIHDHINKDNVERVDIKPPDWK